METFPQEEKQGCAGAVAPEGREQLSTGLAQWLGQRRLEAQPRLRPRLRVPPARGRICSYHRWRGVQGPV